MESSSLENSDFQAGLSVCPLTVSRQGPRCRVRAQKSPPRCEDPEPPPRRSGARSADVHVSWRCGGTWGREVCVSCAAAFTFCVRDQEQRPFLCKRVCGSVHVPPMACAWGGHAGLRGSQGSGQRVCLSQSSLSSAKAHPSHWDLDASVPSPSHLCCVVCLRSGQCMRGPQGARPGLCSAGARLSEFRRLTAVFCFLLAALCQASVSPTVFGMSMLVCSSAGGYFHGFK